MRLLLLQPPVADFYDTDIRLQPIGLCALKSVVRRHHPDIEVLIRDYHHGWGRRTIPLPAELRYLKPYYGQPDRSPFSTFHHFFHFGADYDRIAAEVAALAPDLVGISSLFSPYYREVLACARAIKERCQAPIIVGGSHASAVPEQMLADTSIDFVIRGEGERPLVLFLQAWKEGSPFSLVPNLGYKDQGVPILNEREENFPLADLPIPDLSDLPRRGYLYEGRPIAFIVTSRGCPHRCSFCSVRQTFGQRYRWRGVAAVLAEMRQRWDEGYRVFDFEDDNLTFDLDRAKELCRAIIAEFGDRPDGGSVAGAREGAGATDRPDGGSVAGVREGAGATDRIELLAMNGISHASLDNEVLRLMRQAGFSHLNLALVSTSSEVLASVARPHPPERFSAIVAAAHDLGFKLVAYQIAGLPADNRKAMIATMAYLARLPLLIGLSIFYLTPGAPIAADLPPMDDRAIYLSRSTAMAMETPACRRDDLYTFLVTARILNFLKGLPISRGEEIDLEAALAGAQQTGNARTGAGVTILRRLLTEEKMHCWLGKDRFLPLPRFRWELFREIQQTSGRVATQAGGVININKY